MTAYSNLLIILSHALIGMHTKHPHFYRFPQKRSVLGLESLTEQITVGAIAVFHTCYAYTDISAIFPKMLREF
jgi:hypothetical protein